MCLNVSCSVSLTDHNGTKSRLGISDQIQLKRLPKQEKFYFPVSHEFHLSLNANKIAITMLDQGIADLWKSSKTDVSTLTLG